MYFQKYFTLFQCVSSNVVLGELSNCNFCVLNGRLFMFLFLIFRSICLNITKPLELRNISLFAVQVLQFPISMKKYILIGKLLILAKFQILTVNVNVSLIHIVYFKICQFSMFCVLKINVFIKNTDVFLWLLL